MFSLKEPNQRLIRWKLRLEEYNFEIRYKKGKENKVADALSRIEINALTRKQKNDKINGEDDDLISILPNIDSEFSLSPNDADEILNNNDFENTNSDLLDDLPLIERLNRMNANNDDDDITVHTSEENPICGLSYSERNIYIYL